MRRIRKTHPPAAFNQWLEDNKGLDCSYRALVGKPAHETLKKQLIREQGYLCAYTGQEVDKDTSHIEHLKPQNECVGTEDVDYRNMVACFPFDGGDQSCGYGAPVKQGWWDQGLFVSPLSDDCERRFIFSWSGKISPSPPNHTGAKRTIEVLRLDHHNLQELRRKAINGFFGFGGRAKPLSKTNARRLLDAIDQVNSSGKLIPFCFVLKPLLEKYIAKQHTQGS